MTCSITASATLDNSVADTLAPYISLQGLDNLANDHALGIQKQDFIVYGHEAAVCFLTSLGSKLPSRSRELDK